MSETLDLIRSGVHPSELVGVDRDDTITIIRAALKKRSGKTWSVTGSRGSSWGWITITSPPKRREGWGTLSEADQNELSELLGERVHHQGVSIPASSEYRREYLSRALGLDLCGTKGEPYWD